MASGYTDHTDQHHRQQVEELQLRETANQLAAQIDDELIQLNVKGLCDIAEKLDIRRGRYINRSRQEVIREIRSNLDREFDDDAHQCITKLTEVKNHIMILMQEPNNWEQGSPTTRTAGSLLGSTVASPAGRGRGVANPGFGRGFHAGVPRVLLGRGELHGVQMRRPAIEQPYTSSGFGAPRMSTPGVGRGRGRDLFGHVDTAPVMGHSAIRTLGQRLSAIPRNQHRAVVSSEDSEDSDENSAITALQRDIQNKQADLDMLLLRQQNRR